jgi:hypothetical protein
LFLALQTWPSVAYAQGGLVVTVTSTATQMPVAGAVVRSVRLKRAERVDRLGRARFASVPRPDTLIVAAVGFRPDTLIATASASQLHVILLPYAVPLNDLTVAASGTTDLAPSLTGAWVMPGTVMDNVPAAVERDPLRALSIVPSVSFSSPLSARPVIRGYDAVESVIRINGFEILNPYHIGRVFSSFPGDATESVTVTPAPTSSADGGTLAGLVDVRGRNVVDATGPGGGMGISLLSGTGWFGTATPIPVFVGARVTLLQTTTDVVSESGIPYNFQDLYASTRIPLGASRSWDVTFYGSQDDFSELEAGIGMEWSNLLVGNRWRLLDTPGVSVDATAFANRFALEGADLEARNSRIDVSNTFDRLSLGLLAELRRGTVSITAGGGLGWRRMANKLSVGEGDDFVPTDQESHLTDFQAFVDAQTTRGPLTLTAGVRVDASDEAVAWQPRARLSASMTEGLSAAVSVSRTSRLYQLITDPQPEPSISFYDFWFNAGEGDVPVPRVDHVTMEIDRVAVSWSAHAATFFSKGSGLGELRPIWDQQVNLPPFRFGESRTYGLELRGAWRPGSSTGPSGALTYVLSRSERKWDSGGWRPWHLDRRHNIRLQVDAPLGDRWHLFAISEVFSGQPMTVPEEVVLPVPPRLPTDTSSAFGLVRYLYGEEGAGRSAGTLRLDFGARVEFDGPGKSRINVGLSVINFGFGPVAPEAPLDPFELIRPDGSYPSDGVEYKRQFSLPAVPSITARIEF